MPYKDKDTQREYVRQWVAKRRQEFFADKSCVVCGSTEDLELDHIDPETKVSHRIWSWSESKRLEEISKCQVLCAGHHKDKTAVQKREKLAHGTYTMYNEGCKCLECKAYKAMIDKRYREKVIAQ